MASSSIGGINSVNFNIGNGDLANSVKPVLTAARTVQGASRKNSLSAMTKDLIMEYPVFIDNSIDVDTQMCVLKSDERNYAALQMALWSADTAFGVDPTSSGGVRDFIRKYHSNSDTPDLVSYAGNLTRNISAFNGEYSADSINGDVEILELKKINSHMSKEDVESLWDTVDDMITTESVNDVYLPHKIVLDKIETIARAIEATNNPPSPNGNNPKGPDEDFATRLYRTQANGYKTNVDHGHTAERKKSMRQPMENAKIVETPKALTTLEPTFLEVSFFVRGKDGGQIQKAIVGIKCMARCIPANVMCSNIISALQGSNKAFQFVRWTRGEVKFVKDMIFNVSQIKQDALTRDRFDAYFGAMRKRKNNFRTFKFGDQTVNPFTTLVLSIESVENIKSSAGYDLMDPAIAQRLIDALFLLSVQVVDSSTGLVHTMMDDWAAYNSITIKMLNNMAKNSKDTDMLQIKEVLRLMNRSVY